MIKTDCLMEPYTPVRIRLDLRAAEKSLRTYPTHWSGGWYVLNERYLPNLDKKFNHAFAKNYPTNILRRVPDDAETAIGFAFSIDVHAIYVSVPYDIDMIDRWHDSPIRSSESWHYAYKEGVEKNKTFHGRDHHLNEVAGVVAMNFTSQKQHCANGSGIDYFRVDHDEWATLLTIAGNEVPRLPMDVPGPHICTSCKDGEHMRSHYKSSLEEYRHRVTKAEKELRDSQNNLESAQKGLAAYEVMSPEEVWKRFQERR